MDVLAACPANPHRTAKHGSPLRVRVFAKMREAATQGVALRDHLQSSNQAIKQSSNQAIRQSSNQAIK
jgi:hypothetical protein